MDFEQSIKQNSSGKKRQNNVWWAHLLNRLAFIIPRTNRAKIQKWLLPPTPPNNSRPINSRSKHNQAPLPKLVGQSLLHKCVFLSIPQALFPKKLLIGVLAELLQAPTRPQPHPISQCRQRQHHRLVQPMRWKNQTIIQGNLKLPYNCPRWPAQGWWQGWHEPKLCCEYAWQIFDCLMQSEGNRWNLRNSRNLGDYVNEKREHVWWDLLFGETGH